jgi:hypothetical protein
METTMRDLRGSGALPKALSAQQDIWELRRRSRIFAFSAKALGLLFVALNFAPVVLGQSQSGSSSASPAQASAPTSGQTAGQTSVQAKPQAPSQSEPQMLDQSGPPAESLAEVARKAKAQKANSGAGKVYTEEKLAGLSGRGISSVGSGNQGGDASSSLGDPYANPGADAAPQSGKSDEKYWRGKAQAIRDQMAGLDKQIAGIQEEIKEKGAVTVDPMSGVQAGVIYIEDRNRQIKEIEGQKAKLQEQLDALAEEGRKAGADSGWFR